MEENPFYDGSNNQVVANNFGGLSLQSYGGVTSIKEENTRLKLEPFSPDDTNRPTMSSSNSSFDRADGYGRFSGPGTVDASSGLQSRERMSREHSGLLSIPCPPKKRAQGNASLAFGLSINSNSSPQDLSMATSITSQGMTNRSIGINSESGMSNVRDLQMYGGPCDVTLTAGEVSSAKQNMSLPKNGMRVSSVSFAPNVSVKTSISSGLGLSSECNNMSDSTTARRQATGGVDSNALASVSGSLVMNLSQGKEDGRKRVHDDVSVSRILTISPVGEGKKIAFETSQVKNGKLTIMKNPVSGKGSDNRRNSIDPNQFSMSSKTGISRAPSNHKATGNMQDMAILFKSGKMVPERMHLALTNSPMRHESMMMSMDMGLSGDHGLKGSHRNAMLSVKQEKGTFWPEKPKIDTGNMKSSIVLTNLQRGNIPTIMQTVVEPIEKDIHQKAGHGELHESDFVGSKDINERDQHRKTPLMWASMFGQAPTVGLLLSRKADVNAVDLSQYTALHFAAAGGHHEIVKMLLSAGAIVDARDCHRNTPLMISVMKNHAHVVNELILSGASLVKLNKSNHNALALAVNYRSKDARLVIENQLRSVMRGMAGKEKNA